MHPEDGSDDIPSNSTPSPVDISRVKASDTVQSHLSTSYSSKRMRISPNVDFVALGRSTNSDQTEILPIAHSPQVRKDFLAWIFPFHTPSSGRISTRLERSWTTLILKCLLLLYCALSCIVATIKFYSNVIHPLSAGEANESQAVGAKANVKTMEQYLTRSLTTPAIKFEPFVLANMRPNSSVTICAWLPDTDLPFMNKWLTNWNDSISLLITTTASPGSSLHAKLLKAIRKSIPKSVVEGLSLHVLHLGPNAAESPNLYLNLARLFALTDWTLLFPEDIRRPLSRKIEGGVIPTEDKRGTGIYVLSSGKTDSYPFPALSPVLLRRKPDFWCTERIFMRISRTSDWSECLWQASLETIGKIHVLNVPNKDPAPAKDESAVEGIVNQRLSARFRAEMCDMFLKQVDLVHPRGRYKEMSLDWVKSFCTKTVNRKLSR